MALGHHSLVAWQRADDLFVRLHQLSLKTFPAFERFELGAQLRRSAFSVAVNIVEGSAKPKGKARLNFFNTSRASLAEVGYCLHVARRLGYISDSVFDDLEVEIKRVGAPLGGLIASTRASLAVKTAAATALLLYLTVRLA
jgi:four helix bundle protein